MKNDLSCDVVHDLLPSYVDGLTSQQTNSAVEEHIQTCEQCALLISNMKDSGGDKNEQTAEVDYLKKVHRHISHVGMICGIVMMVLGMAVICGNIFYLGKASQPLDAQYHVAVENNTLKLSGNLKSSSQGVARIKFEENDGVINVRIYTAPKTFVNKNKFSEEYTADSEIVAVRSNQLILWENGHEIDSMAAQLYAAVNEYVGNMPANAKIAQILDIQGQFGTYTNELQTSSEPYGWTICIEQQQYSQEENGIQDMMEADSYVMLAAVGNLDYVTWKYKTQEGEREFTVTEQQATDFAGGDIKAFAKSATGTQELMQKFMVKWSGLR